MKHRLVGAVILVSAAVLVIPWLLSGPAVEGEAGRDAGGRVVVSEVIPLPAGNDAGSAAESDSGSTEQPPAAGATRPALLDQGGRWAVRVGTYARQANADSVSARLADSGFTVHKDAVKTDTGDATRIWLGPYSKKQAGEVSARLKTLIGEQGFVTGYAP